MKKIKIQTGFRLSERDKQYFSQKIVYTNLKNNLHINIPFEVKFKMNLNDFILIISLFKLLFNRKSHKKSTKFFI